MQVVNLQPHAPLPLGRAAAREIEWDCTRLLHDFYGFLDEKRYGELADLFMPDGVWVRLGVELTGPRAILEAMQVRDDWLTAHVVSNLRVTALDADHAQSVQYVTLYRQEGYNPASGPAPVVPPLALLRHADSLVRSSTGWKFQRKTSRAIMANRERVTHYDRPAAA